MRKNYLILRVPTYRAPRGSTTEEMERSVRLTGRQEQAKRPESLKKKAVTEETKQRNSVLSEGGKRTSYGHKKKELPYEF
jgi:hypothetical protein